MPQKKVKNLNRYACVLVVLAFCYLVTGAAIFSYLENTAQMARFSTLMAMKDLMIRRYNISGEDYKMLEATVIENKSYKSGPQWKFFGSFYFSTLVVTMIGYGHSTPVTVAGKCFCMVFACIGIPLGLVMFQSIGERLNNAASSVISKLKALCGARVTIATHMNLLLVTVILSNLIIAFSAFVFSRREGWTYFDAWYYCFITLTTVGFGDYVALQQFKDLNDNPLYVAFTLLFILFGLAVVAASINLLVLRFMVNADMGDGEGDQTTENEDTSEGDYYIVTGDGNDGVVIDQESLCKCELSLCCCFSDSGKSLHVEKLRLRNSYEPEANNYK